MIVLLSVSPESTLTRCIHHDRHWWLLLEQGYGTTWLGGAHRHNDHGKEKIEGKFESQMYVFLSSKILFLVFLFRVFGHISYRSDWELVKVDFRPSFPRECSDDDYESWELTNLQVFMVLC